MLYGATPFVAPTLNDTPTYVVGNPLVFPKNGSQKVSSEAKHLMAALLLKDPEKRLGTKKGAAEIKAHPFFAGLEWENVRNSVRVFSTTTYSCRALGIDLHPYLEVYTYTKGPYLEVHIHTRGLYLEVHT